MKSEIESTLPVTCCGIRLTQQNLSEIDSGRIMVTIAREDIRRVTLRHGIQASHPIIQLFAGIILSGLGYFPIRHFVHWFQHGGFYFDVEALILVPVVAGLFLVVGAFKKGYFLEVELPRANKRLSFERNPDPTELQNLIRLIEEHYTLKVLRDA